MTGVKRTWEEHDLAGDPAVGQAVRFDHTGQNANPFEGWQRSSSTGSVLCFLVLKSRGGKSRGQKPKVLPCVSSTYKLDHLVSQIHSLSWLKNHGN